MRSKHTTGAADSTEESGSLAIRTALRLEIITLAWMVIEAAGSIVAGIVASSLLLIAFGADSVIELVSAGILYWRLHREASGTLNEEAIEAVERKASWIAGYLLYALAAYVIGLAAYGLWRHHAAEASWLGIGIGVIAAAGMPILAHAKIRVADQIGSQALRADAMESFTCGYLSWVLLLGLLANALAHLWWLDSAATLLLIPFLLREARETVTGHCTCDSR